MLSLAGTLLTWYTVASNPGAVRFVTKDNALILCTQSGQHLGFRDDQPVEFGTGPCPDEGGAVIAAVQYYRPWLFRIAVGLTCLGVVASVLLACCS